MPFKKGEPRAAGAGRKKGTPDKKSLLVRELLENNGINLIDEILVRLPKLRHQEDQVKALIAMLPYVYPKLTSIEHSGDIDLNSAPTERIKKMAEDLSKTKEILKETSE